MSDTKTRRTVALLDGSRGDLETIKTKTGMSTDNAAINEAVNFRARVLETCSDLGLKEEVFTSLKFRAKVLEACSEMNSPEEVLSAISIYNQIKTEMKTSGSLLFLENPKNPSARVRVLVP